MMLGFAVLSPTYGMRSVQPRFRIRPNLARVPVRVLFQLHHGGFRISVMPAQVFAIHQDPQIAQSKRHRVADRSPRTLS